ncbi:MAG: hypothetical protein HYR71_08735 [Chloroflexi bacterium]|nr:hypothetical protein [Chloroflexota bacterium]
MTNNGQPTSAYRNISRSIRAGVLIICMIGATLAGVSEALALATVSFEMAGLKT